MSERELLLRVTAKDFIRKDIRGSGPGGQHRNKTSTGVRLTHRASGAVGEATDNRSQMVNRTEAFKRCIATPVFKAWLRTAIAEASGRPSIAQRVDAAMSPENITTQVLDDNDRWVDVNPADLKGEPV